MKRASMLALLPLMLCAARSPSMAAQPAAEANPGNYIPPKVLGRPPEFMGNVGFSNREALVYERFTVSPKGKVIAAEPLLDKGFYDDDFLDTATDYMKSLRFEPATLDGKPIEFTAVLPIRFTIGEPGGIGRDFRVQLSQVEGFFKQGDYHGADQHAEMMLRDTVKTHVEFAALKVTLARTHAALGQDELALRFAEDATARDLPDTAPFALHGPLPANKLAYYSLSMDILKSMLELRMRLNARNGMLVEARQAYDELAGLEAIPPADPRAQVAAQITEKLAGKDPLAANGHIVDERSWHHALIRNTFSLDKVDGEIHSVLLTCRNNQQKLNYVPGEEWQVPADWRDCSVSVDGAPGSSFQFVETID